MRIHRLFPAFALAGVEGIVVAIPNVQVQSPSGVYDLACLGGLPVGRKKLMAAPMENVIACAVDPFRYLGRVGGELFEHGMPMLGVRRLSILFLFSMASAPVFGGRVAFPRQSRKHFLNYQRYPLRSEYVEFRDDGAGVRSFAHPCTNHINVVLPYHGLVHFAQIFPPVRQL